MWTFFHVIRENISASRRNGLPARRTDFTRKAPGCMQDTAPTVLCAGRPYVTSKQPSGEPVSMHPDSACLSPGDPAPLCADRLRGLLDEAGFATEPVILCIGTDRLIGDCLGPFLGTLLERTAKDRLQVYGTLSRAVHALNLPDTISKIKRKHPNRPVIAVDASLGAPEHVGSVFVRSGSLHPGAGVRKELPKAGDISITGIVGSFGPQPYLNLQTVRLSTIAAMADEICRCILDVCM